MSAFSIKNWEAFQHYRDRRPHWIKLHASTLTDFDFMHLPREPRGLLMQLWLLAAESDGVVRYDRDWLAFRLNLPDFRLEELSPLFSVGFLLPDDECSVLQTKASSVQTEDTASSLLCTTSCSVLKEGGVGGGGRKFKPPDLEAVTAYCREKKLRVNPEKFLSHYESNGWMVGRNKMRDWKAACRTWNSNERERSRGGATNSAGIDQERVDAFAELDRELAERGVAGA